MINIRIEQTRSLLLTDREVRDATIEWLKAIIGDHFISDGWVMIRDEHPHSGSIEHDRVWPITDSRALPITNAVRILAEIRALCVNFEQHRVKSGVCPDCGERIVQR